MEVDPTNGWGSRPYATEPSGFGLARLPGLGPDLPLFEGAVIIGTELMCLSPAATRRCEVCEEGVHDPKIMSDRTPQLYSTSLFQLYTGRKSVYTQKYHLSSMLHVTLNPWLFLKIVNQIAGIMRNRLTTNFIAHRTRTISMIGAQ